MCGSCFSRPCVKSCFGLPLKTAVFAIGIIQIIITVLATIINVLNLSNKLKDECDGVDVCAGPIIKYSVVDAFQGVGCGLLLIFGSKSKNSCLLWSWIIVVVCVSLKYWWVVFTHDWTAMEDWIAITYLLFFTITFWIVVSFICETNSSSGTIHGPLTFTPVPAQPTIVLNTTVMPNQAPAPYPQQQMYQQPQYPPPQPQYPPPQYPSPQYQYPNQNPPPYNPY